MTANIYNKLTKITDQINEVYKIDYLVNYSSLDSIYKRALYYNKTQNELCKDGYNFDQILRMNFYYQKIDSCSTVTIKANLNLDRLEWFKLLICNEFYVPLEETNQITKLDLF